MFGINLGLGDIFAEERQEDAQQYASAEAAINRNWQARMDNTAIERRYGDMKRAGVNPLLSVHPGGIHGTPSGSMASSGIAGSGGSTSVQMGPTTAAQVKLLEAQADREQATADETRARTPTHDATRRLTEAQIPRTNMETQELEQRIGESAARIEKIWAEAQAATASAANIEQQTRNLKEMVPQIRAQVGHLKALAAKESAATDEIKQKVAQNLPELERKLMNIERIQGEMAQAGHANQERAQESLMGQIGAYLRTLGSLPAVIINRRPR